MLVIFPRDAGKYLFPVVKVLPKTDYTFKPRRRKWAQFLQKTGRWRWEIYDFYMKSSTNLLPHWCTKVELFGTSVENPGLQLSSIGSAIAGRLVPTEPSSWLYFGSYLILILYCTHHHSVWIHTNAMLQLKNKAHSKMWATQETCN